MTTIALTEDDATTAERSNGPSGPKITIKASCLDCRHCTSTSYRVQGDSGHDVRCSLEGKRIGDTTWDTPPWCPLVAGATDAATGAVDLRAEIARLTAELAAARAVPVGDGWALVAAMLDATTRLAVNGDPSSINKGRCEEWADCVSAKVRGAAAVWLDSIIDADDFPIDAQPRIGHCVVEHARRWYDSEHPLGVDDVGVLAGLDPGELARQPATVGTVGGLLATAPVGSIVETCDGATFERAITRAVTCPKDEIDDSGDP